jgi:guanylate kinase
MKKYSSRTAISKSGTREHGDDDEWGTKRRVEEAKDEMSCDQRLTTYGCNDEIVRTVDQFVH